MTLRISAATVASVALLAAGCQSHSHATAAHTTRTAGAGADGTRQPLRVYVSNERSNDISVIDGATNAVVATIPVGKRPRGIHLSRDGRRLFVALSGSPIGGPNVRDEDLPPADKKADGIGVVEVATGKFVGKINSGSDPEQFSLSRDDKPKHDGGVVMLEGVCRNQKGVVVAEATGKILVRSRPAPA